MMLIKILYSISCYLELLLPGIVAALFVFRQSRPQSIFMRALIALPIAWVLLLFLDYVRLPISDRYYRVFPRADPIADTGEGAGLFMLGGALPIFGVAFAMLACFIVQRLKRKA